MRYLLHDVFLETQKCSPDATAIVMEDGRAVTYKALNTLANRFANCIKNLKPSVLQRPFVGIISSVHIESVAAVLGILKIGCAYIPLDEYSPRDRLDKIINNTKLDVVCIDSHLVEKYTALFENPWLKHIIILNSEAPVTADDKVKGFEVIQATDATEPHLLNQVSDDLAYILHSSGSTGIPKGIMLTHRNARTFVDWMQKEFKLTHHDVVMSRAPLKFDLSVFDIFNTLKAGAKLVCFDWNKSRPLSQKHGDYVSLMEKEKATLLYTTPSTFISLLNRGGLGEKALSLRTIMYAGEPFPPAQLKKVMQALPNTKVANIYGPTETNIITYYWVNTLPDMTTPIPLGAAVDDTEIIVVCDEQHRLCEPDELGELWCRGGTVTLGYLGMQDKTKACLIQSPFHPYPAFFWRTGDFGFFDKQGVLHYRGRRDHMVKVKGYRIELGEIENALSAHPDLDEFAVVAVPDSQYTNRLYCHFSVLKGRHVEVDAIKHFLSHHLPEYMLPYQFIKWEALPTTSSGKIDRLQLTKSLEK
jgi:amino acid adenylation domain-containing protein